MIRLAIRVECSGDPTRGGRRRGEREREREGKGLEEAEYGRGRGGVRRPHDSQ